MITKAILGKADVIVQGDSVYFLFNKKASIQLIKFNNVSSHCVSKLSIIELTQYTGWVDSRYNIFVSYREIEYDKK